MYGTWCYFVVEVLLVAYNKLSDRSTSLDFARVSRLWWAMTTNDNRKRTAEIGASNSKSAQRWQRTTQRRRKKHDKCEAARQCLDGASFLSCWLATNFCLYCCSFCFYWVTYNKLIQKFAVYHHLFHFIHTLISSFSSFEYTHIYVCVYVIYFKCMFILILLFVDICGYLSQWSWCEIWSDIFELLFCINYQFWNAAAPKHYSLSHVVTITYLCVHIYIYAYAYIYINISLSDDANCYHIYNKMICRIHKKKLNVKK